MKNNIFNESEYLQICRELKANPFVKQIVLRYEDDNFFNKMKRGVENNRTREVVFGVIRPNRKIIAVTCEEYPEGIFRIPSGGVGDDENIIDAVYREVKEELGLEVGIKKFAGVLKIKFEYKNDSFMFYSYIFILEEIGGKLLENALDDEISGIKEIDIDDLKPFEDMVDSLKNIEGKWRNWGLFRYHSSKAVLDSLKSMLKETL